ncbi:acetylcholinesterase-like [Centruroides sculpturatus]|uniref:acetylcholinesterase-like n=1 Tax=Centruroides sculpturatus TaxID=218467 RepID=UPI000C6EA849|nr:acetylcholinesterase-like [Centruroides sculpturatus]
MRNLFKCLLLVCIFKSYFAEKIVQTELGRIRGKKINALNNDVYAFLGIPYATPPLGKLRFKAPQPVTKWEDIYNATVMSPICMQDPVFPVLEWVPRERRYMSEDCLYLNIWVPVENKENKPFSTMVWIHGGAFNTGSGNMDVHYGRILASYGNVIVVTINYRLGTFGFLNLDNEAAPGNMAFLDQVMALKWVHTNIESFGGDKEGITVFGTSSGAAAISLHLVSPLTKGLFKRAILQSGGCCHHHLEKKKNKNIKTSKRVAANVGCNNGTEDNKDIIDCLMQTDAFKIAAGEKQLLKNRNRLVSYFTQLGEPFLPDDPIEYFDNGLIHDVEIMAGIVPEEASMILAYYKPEILNQDNPGFTMSKARNILNTIYNFSKPKFDNVMEEYFGNVQEDDYTRILERTRDVIGDGIVKCPVISLTEKLSVKNYTVYRYTFNHARINTGYKKWEGVAHFAEIYFMFGLPFVYPEKYIPEEEEFSKQVMQYWVSFAKTGKPSCPDQEEEWLPFTKENRNVMKFDLGNIHRINEEPKKQCKLWKHT